MLVLTCTTSRLNQGSSSGGVVVCVEQAVIAAKTTLQSAVVGLRLCTRRYMLNISCTTCVCLEEVGQGQKAISIPQLKSALGRVFGLEVEVIFELSTLNSVGKLLNISVIYDWKLITYQLISDLLTLSYLLWRMLVIQ